MKEGGLVAEACLKLPASRKPSCMALFVCFGAAALLLLQRETLLEEF